MDIKDIISVGLTAADFEILIEGLKAIPEKEYARETLAQIMENTILGRSQSIEETKRKAMNAFKAIDKKTKEREDDFAILTGKLIMLKRLLMSNEAIKMANEILGASHT